MIFWKMARLKRVAIKGNAETQRRPSLMRECARFRLAFSLLVAVLSCGMSCSAVAQEGDIIVRGTPLPESLGSTAYDSVTIDQDRLSNTASGRIEDALRDVAGLQQFRRTDARSANATSQGATLRGLGGNASSRALLVLDGVPQSDPFGGWVTWPAFAPARLGRIKVTRGGGSGDYGSGALSGTIELESISGSTGSKAALAYGSRNSVDASVLLGSNQLGGGSGFVAATYARGDGFIPIVEGQRGPADQRAPYEQGSLAARAVLPLGNDTEFQASALAFSDRRSRGTILSGNGGDGADASIRLVHTGDWGWQALAYLQMRKFHSGFVAIDASRTTVSQTVSQYNVPSTGVGARFEVRPPVGEDVELRLGGDWRRVSGETKELFTYVAGLPTRGREAGGKADTVGAFAELSAKVGALTLTGGGRADHWSLGNGRLIERTLATGTLIRNELAARRSGWEGTGRAGASWQTGDFTLRSAAYLGWRLPTLNELYRPFRVGADATAANAALAPERMRGAEVGFGWALDGHEPVDPLPADIDPGVQHLYREVPRLSLSLTLFANRLTDAIANVSLGKGPGTFPGVGFVAAGGAYRQRLNVDAIRSRGIELDANYNAGDWHLSASYAYTDARVRASGSALALNGLRPAQVPQHMASATLGWRWVSGTVRYISAQFEDDQNVRRLRDALTFDAVATMPLNDHFSLSLRGENLANVQVDAAISASGVIERASPRTVWIGIAVR